MYPMNYLLLLLSFICIPLGIDLWFKRNKLFVASLWIINAALFSIVAITKPGFCVSMFYMPLGIYITMYYFTHLKFNKACKYFIVLCVFEMVFTNSLQFMNWPYMSEHITYYKTIIVIIMFIPVFYSLYKFSKASQQLVAKQFTQLNFEYYIWLKNLVHISVSCCVFVILIGIIHTWIGEVTLAIEIGLLSMLCASIYVYYISCYKFTNPLLFVNQEDHKMESVDIKYLQEHGIEKLEHLEHLIEIQKVYLDTNLNLQKLASQMNMHPKQLSKLINQHYQINFQEFINKRRIQEAKNKLLDHELSHLTISALGQESGFNSRSSFYNSFKKEVGCTPKEFQKSMQTDKNAFSTMTLSA